MARTPWKKNKTLCHLTSTNTTSKERLLNDTQLYEVIVFATLVQEKYQFSVDMISLV